MVSFDDVQKMQKVMLNLQKEYWLQHDLFHWHWWLLLGLTILPWMAWWKLVDKKRLMEILFFGLIIMIISMIFDLVASDYMVWAYPHRLHWSLHPILLPYDVTIMPVSFMLIYQCYRHGKQFTIGLVLLAAGFSWVAEPLLEWMGFYVRYTWKSIYSFAIYIGIGLLTKWIVNQTLVKMSNRNP